MARTERNNVDYFPHSVLHGRKMFYLREKYGNDGYAVWFMLLEELGKAEYHFLDLKDDVQLMFLSSSFKVSEDVLISIINDLVKFDEFNVELWKDRIIFSEKFNLSIEDAYRKRNNNCITFDGILLLLKAKGRKLTVKGRSKGGSNPQRIEEDRKVEKKYKSWSDESENKKYNYFVDWILSEGLEKVFKMNDQINEKWFTTITESADFDYDKIKRTISSMEAKADLLKRYDSFARTLNNWVKK